MSSFPTDVFHLQLSGKEQPNGSNYPAHWQKTGTRGGNIKYCQKTERREEGGERERDHWHWLDWLWTVEWLCTTNYISGAAGLAGLPGLPLAGKVRRHSSAVKWNIISQFFILHWDLRPGALRYKHPLIILNNQDITHDWWECISLHLSMHTKNTTKWNTDVLVKLE